MKWRRFCVVQFKASTSLRATPGHLNFLRSCPSNSPPPPWRSKPPASKIFYWTIERSFEWSTNVAEFCSYIIVFDAAVGFSAHKLHSAIFLRGHLLTPADSLPLNFFIFKIKTRVFRWFKFPIPSKQLSNFPTNIFPDDNEMLMAVVCLQKKEVGRLDLVRTNEGKLVTRTISPNQVCNALGGTSSFAKWLRGHFVVRMNEYLITFEKFFNKIY